MVIILRIIYLLIKYLSYIQLKKKKKEENMIHKTNKNKINY